MTEVEEKRAAGGGHRVWHKAPGITISDAEVIEVAPDRGPSSMPVAEFGIKQTDVLSLEVKSVPLT